MGCQGDLAHWFQLPTRWVSCIFLLKMVASRHQLHVQVQVLLCWASSFHCMAVVGKWASVATHTTAWCHCDHNGNQASQTPILVAWCGMLQCAAAPWVVRLYTITLPYLPRKHPHKSTQARWVHEHTRQPYTQQPHHKVHGIHWVYHQATWQNEHGLKEGKGMLQT